MGFRDKPPAVCACFLPWGVFSFHRFTQVSFHDSDRWSVWSVWSAWSAKSSWSIPSTVHHLDLPGRADTYTSNLHDLYHLYDMYICIICMICMICIICMTCMICMIYSQYSSWSTSARQGRHIPDLWPTSCCRVEAAQSAWSRKGFPGLDHLYYTDPAQHLTTAGGNLDDLDRDLSDLDRDLSVRGV